MTPAPNQTADRLERTRDVIERVYKNPLGVPESLLAPQAVLALQKEGLLLSEGAPSEEQVERAAVAMQAESAGFFSTEAWRHLARVGLTAAGVAPQDDFPTPGKHLDSEKVAEVVEEIRREWRTEWLVMRELAEEDMPWPEDEWLVEFICEADKEGKLT